jgi:tRNA(Ile)-lysidine synthase TilS/MesJ
MIEDGSGVAVVISGGKDSLALQCETLLLNCQRCTWNRRRTLFEAAYQSGCSTVAMGQHADDLAQTTLLNLLHQGHTETMASRRDYFGGRMRIIRLLCLSPEKAVRRNAQSIDLPDPPPTCLQAAGITSAKPVRMCEQTCLV